MAPEIYVLPSVAIELHGSIDGTMLRLKFVCRLHRKLRYHVRREVDRLLEARCAIFQINWAPLAPI